MALQPLPRRAGIPVRAVSAPLLLSDAVLTVLGKRADILSEFPFFRLSLPGMVGGCSRCNRNAQNRHASSSEYERVKSALGTLQPERIARLKTLLNTAVVIYFLTGPKGAIKRSL